jgi:hypothetical protein
VQPAPRLLQMQAPIKRLSVAGQLRQSRLMEPDQQPAPEVSTRIHGLKVRLRLVRAQR